MGAGTSTDFRSSVASKYYTNSKGRRLDPDDPEDDRLVSAHSLAEKLRIRPEDADVLIRNRVEIDKIPKAPYLVRSMVKYLRKHETPPPKWMVASGMYPELYLDPGERRQRIRTLYKAAVLIIRRELKRHEVDEFRAERSIFWDPVSEVCQSMEISPSKLSSFCKELTGNNLNQVIDSVRAESLKRKLRVEIRAFVNSQVPGSRFKVPGSDGLVPGSGFQVPGCDGATGEQDSGRARCASSGTECGDKWAVWKALKASRRWPEFSQSTWAQGLGFSSYRLMDTNELLCLCLGWLLAGFYFAPLGLSFSFAF